MTNLDTTVNNRIDRFYTRLVQSYQNRLKAARDKAYAHDQFLKRAKANSILMKELDENYALFCDLLEEKYRLGKSIEPAINQFRVQCEENMQVYFVEAGTDWPNDREEGDDNSAITNKKGLNKKSDYELACLFADQKANDLFYEFMNTKNITEELKGSNNSQENLKEITENNKEFTTARQVLAVHFLLKYTQVRNVDKSEIARFVQFLTGKNYDNIYKRVRKPYTIHDKTFKQDLRFVREYFEKLQLPELVKMINNEIDAEA
jgi:hypothetical protein